MTVTTTDFEVFVQEHEEESIPCDYAQFSDWDEIPHTDARWIARLRECECGSPAKQRLICDTCRWVLLYAIRRLRCRDCGKRRAVSDVVISITPLKGD